MCRLFLPIRMNELSRQGILEILHDLETHELISLGNTVSHGLLKDKIRTPKDAIETIIDYSPNVVSILRRKIVRRHHLFSYLHKKRIPVTLPATKKDLAFKILEFWKVPKSSRNSKSEVNSSEDNESGIQEIPAEENTCTDVSAQSNNDDMYSMALQFSQWFYTLINQNAPIGTEHFYPDASLKINVFTGGTDNTEEVQSNPEEICALLFRKRMEYNLFFNPNLSKEGCQGQMDPHGLVIVLTCGTLHANDCCVGIFEQMFALARDPFADNNWKIKSTQLNLRSKQNVVNSPRLCDIELTSSYLALSDD